MGIVRPLTMASHLSSWTAGQTMLIPAEEHLPENLTDKPLELVLVELKG